MMGLGAHRIAQITRPVENPLSRKRATAAGIPSGNLQKAVERGRSERCCVAAYNCAEMARDANQIVELEREILRAMCGGTVAAAQIDAVRESLRHYAWRDEEHRIVFEALARMRSAD